MNEQSEKKSTINPKYKVVKGLEVTEQDIMRALELDRAFYNLPHDEQFNIEKCLNWNKKTHNRIYTMIKDTETDEIVAYINAVPVNDKCYEEIKAGKYPDVEINDDDIVNYILHGENKLYFASIVIDNKKDVFIRFRMLYEAFLDKLIKLTKEDIIVSRIIADAISPEGKKLCEGVGMKKIKDTKHNESAIYEFEVYPPSFRIISPKAKELYNILMEKYKGV